MAKKKADLAPSTNILDYPNSMSQYEKESLAAEAALREHMARNACRDIIWMDARSVHDSAGAKQVNE
jgi:hypothetical protein